MPGKPVRLCVVITNSMNLQSLYRRQFSYLVSNGFHVTAVASPGVEHDLVASQGVRSIQIRIERRPSALKDLIALFRLWWFFLFNRFDVISVSTPKASLLASLAAFMAGHRKIVYMVRGRAHENFMGIKRRFYDFLDRLVCAISIKVHFISNELKEEYVKSGVCPPDKAIFLGDGSSNGVDISIFSPERFSLQDKNKIRGDVHIDADKFVFLYSGRLRRDKGIDELIRSFLLFKELCPLHSSVLLLVGSYEDFDFIEEVSKRTIDEDPDIFQVGWAWDVEKYFSIADVFVFPTHREGFGNVAIEAAAMGLPVVAFDVVGCRESVFNMRSGFLCKPYSVEDFAGKMALLYEDSELRKKMGREGVLLAREKFSSYVVWDYLIEFYRKVVGL